MDALAHRQFVELAADHWWFRGRRRLTRRLLERFLDADGEPLILDVGAGPGGSLATLEVFGRVAALDREISCCLECRRRGAPAAVAGAGALPVAETAGVVTLLDVIEHLEDDAGALREARAALRPGGLLVVLVPAYPGLYSDNDVLAGHVRRYVRPVLLERVRTTGFEVLYSTYYNSALLPAIAAVIFARKLARRLGIRRGPPARTNLSWRMPRPVNRLLARLFEAEAGLLARVPAPFGHSLAVVARRPAAPAQ